MPRQIEQPARRMALRARALRGVLWSLVEFGGGEAISFVVFLVLARLLVPADFGIVALAGAFIAFVQLFLAQGFPDALVQRERIDAEHLDTAFWSGLAVALLFLVATLAAAGPVARAFGQPLLADVLCLLSPVFVSTALNGVHQAIFRRELRFAAFALRALVGIGVGGVVGIAMALEGFGVWSLVGQQLANGAASVAAIWGSSEWRPRWRFSPARLREMARFAAPVIGSGLVAFCYNKLDIFIVGCFLGPHELGYYYLVQRLLVTTGLVTLSTVQAVVMPVLSRLQADRARFREALATAIQLTQAVWLPVALGLGLVAPSLVPVFFGAAWRPAVPILAIMSLTGFSQVFSFFSAQALFAAGLPAVNLRLSLLQVGVLASLLLPATRFGIVGVAIAFTLAMALLAPVHVEVLRREVGLDPRDLARRCRPPMLAALVMGGAVIALHLALGERLPAPALLALSVALGALAYALALSLAAPVLLRDVLELGEGALGRRFGMALRLYGFFMRLRRASPSWRLRSAASRSIRRS
jgi:PST family polysaccharide transporter